RGWRVARLQFQSVTIRAVRLEHQRVHAAIGIQNVVAMDLVEDAAPIGILKTGESERLVEAAIARDAQIGTENDSDAAADLVDSSRRRVRPGGAENAESFVVAERGTRAQQQQENCDQRE